MIIDPDLIIKCPACGSFQYRHSLGSGNTLNAVYFSDKKYIAPRCYDSPYFVKCPNCNVLFKITKKEVVGKDYDNKYDYPYIAFLSIDEYCRAINEGLYNGNKKDIISLRINLWRLFNDRLRNVNAYSFNFLTSRRIDFIEMKKGSLSDAFETEEITIYEENCRYILSFMSNYKDDEDLLLRAELSRNIGQFENCINFLKKIKNPEKLENYISAIKTACDEENMLTVEVFNESPSIVLF